VIHVWVFLSLLSAMCICIVLYPSIFDLQIAAGKQWRCVSSLLAVLLGPFLEASETAGEKLVVNSEYT
jgi:hypothetical protein